MDLGHFFQTSIVSSQQIQVTPGFFFVAHISNRIWGPQVWKYKEFERPEASHCYSKMFFFQWRKDRIQTGDPHTPHIRTFVTVHIEQDHFVLSAFNDMLCLYIWLFLFSELKLQDTHKTSRLLKNNFTYFFGAMAKVKKKVKTEGSDRPKTSKKAHLEFAWMTLRMIRTWVAHPALTPGSNCICTYSTDTRFLLSHRINSIVFMICVHQSYDVEVVTCFGLIRYMPLLVSIKSTYLPQNLQKLLPFCTATKCHYRCPVLALEVGGVVVSQFVSLQRWRWRKRRSFHRKLWRRSPPCPFRMAFAHLLLLGWLITMVRSFSSLKPMASPSKFPKLHGFINGDDPNLRTAETNWHDPPTTMGGDSAILTFSKWLDDLQVFLKAIQDVVYLSGCKNSAQLSFCKLVV